MTCPITAVDVYPALLPIRSVLHIARGPVSTEDGARHVFVRLRDADGNEGWGEARPSPRWSDETPESVETTIRRYLAPCIEGRDPADIAGLHAAMDAEIAPGLTTGQPIAKSAVDMAAHDLIARRLGVPLASLFGRTAAPRLPLSWIVSAPTPDQAVQQAQQGHDAGYRAFKIKLGIRPEQDVDIVDAIRAQCPDGYLWADANQAYRSDVAIRLAKRLATVGVDILEQPVRARDTDGLRKVRAAGHVPLAVDESVFSATDLLALLRADAFDVLVVKVSKLGGLWHARRCLEIAEEAGISVLGGGLTESGLGASASAALFASVELAGPADLNGPQFLATSPDMPATLVVDGELILPGGSGVGLYPGARAWDGSLTPGHGASVSV